jgi:hypothetical protein
MQLDEAQKQKVSAWIAEGRQLSEIQKLLETEFKVRMTYLEVRFLVDDLKLIPKDEPRSEAPKAVVDAPAAPVAGDPKMPLNAPQEETVPGAVSVTVDTLAKPGAIVSGSVTFSDGQRAAWYLDQMGRLGLAPEQKGYRPTTPDLQAFQEELQRQLQSLGL